MIAQERMLKLLTADAATLAAVDRALAGGGVAAIVADEDCRGCTFSDAARRLGTSRATIYELVRNGRLDVLTLNGSRRIRVSSIAAIANGERPVDAATVERMERNRRQRVANARGHRNGKRGAE